MELKYSAIIKGLEDILKIKEAIWKSTFNPTVETFEFLKKSLKIAKFLKASRFEVSYGRYVYVGYIDLNNLELEAYIIYDDKIEIFISNILSQECILLNKAFFYILNLYNESSKLNLLLKGVLENLENYKKQIVFLTLDAIREGLSVVIYKNKILVRGTEDPYMANPASLKNLLSNNIYYLNKILSDIKNLELTVFFS